MTFKKKNGKWHCYVFLGTDENGKQKRKHITADSRRECEERATAALEASKSPFYDARRMTVLDALNRYIDRKRASLSPRTIRDYVKLRDTTFRRLMKVRLEDLDDNILQAEIDAMVATGVSAKTVKNRWTFLRSAIASADRSFSPLVELPSARKPKFEMPDRDALFDLFNGIAGDSLELPVLLACVCGLRRGEISALDVHTDIDYEKGLLRVNKDMVLDENSAWITKPPKTDAGNRVVPVPRWLLEKLAAAASDPSFKFPVPNTITKDFWMARREHPVGCSFHGLRHYYASIMEAAGVPELYQMERMGHSTPYMLKRYQEYLKEKELEINDAMMSHLDSLNPAGK